MGTTVPTGDDEIGEEGWQPEARLALGWDLSDVWSLGANAGWARPDEAGERFDQALGSVAVGRALGERLGAFAELYGFAPAGADGDDDAAYFDGGLTLGFGLDAQLDVRAGVGLTDASADWLFGLGSRAAGRRDHIPPTGTIENPHGRLPCPARTSSGKGQARRRKGPTGRR